MVFGSEITCRKFCNLVIQQRVFLKSGSINIESKTMNQDIVITRLQKMFILTLEISVPILLVGVVLGLLVSIFQTVTQIQESTLTFVPKIVGCVILLIFLMPWMMSIFITTFNEFMDMIPQLIGVI